MNTFSSYSGRHSTIVFDGDDTLWNTQILYEEAKDRFFSLMASLSLKPEEVARELAQIEIANVEVLGFSTKRFPLSMETTYRKMAHTIGVTIDASIIEQIRIIGFSVFSRQSRQIPGTRHILSRLRQQYRIALWTAGDESIQIKRIAESGLEELFDAIHIVPNKSASGLRALMHDNSWEANATWMVGNSLRSDIIPASTVGLRCVWVKGSSWEYDHSSDEIPEVIQIHSITELPRLLLSADVLQYDEADQFAGID